MENASKALIMAGSILIGVIIMTIGVTIFTSFGGTSEQIQKQMNEKAIAEFNAHFTKYDGMQECTIHDIVSLANFARKYNEEYEDNYIIVLFKSDNLADITKDMKALDKLQDEIEKGTITTTVRGEEYRHIQYYTGEILDRDDSGRVKEIIFTESTV